MIKRIEFLYNVFLEIEENILASVFDKILKVDFSKRYVLGAMRYNDTIIHYETIKKRQFRYIIKHVNKNIDFKDKNIIDLGSGKGYLVYLLNKTNKFNKVAGIELLSELHEIAINNMKRLNIYDKVELVNGDVRNFTGIDNFNYLLMFNPFPKEAMKEVVKQIKLSLDRKPRKICIIYINAVQDKMLYSIPEIEKVKILNNMPCMGCKTIIYKN